MSDTTSKTEPVSDLEARWRERERLSAEAQPANKAAIFDALAAANITDVVLEFDGCGDSGQIERTVAHAGDREAELPSLPLAQAEPIPDGGGLHQVECSLYEAIEALAYELLEDSHGGWENNDGAYGEFTFDVAKRTITLAFNQRFTDSEYSEHVF